jgi:hypothetical protein
MKYIKTQDVLNKKVLTYQEILNIKKRLTGYTNNKHELKKEFTNNDDISQPELVRMTLEDYNFKDEYKITQEHTDKGLEYLYRVTFKPSKLAEQKRRFKKDGILDEALRSNCPLGYREAIILLNFHHFTFTGFYDATNIYQREVGYRTLYPLWKTYSKNGDSFEYYIEGGKMNIVG